MVGWREKSDRRGKNESAQLCSLKFGLYQKKVFHVEENLLLQNRQIGEMT